jgi:hypothetical protein
MEDLPEGSYQGYLLAKQNPEAYEKIL